MTAAASAAPGLLPPAFAELERFVDPWGLLDTQDARYTARISAEMPALQAFYDAMSGRMQAVLDHVDELPATEELDCGRARLFRMALSIAEVVQAVEVFHQPSVPHLDPRDPIHAEWHQGRGPAPA